MKKSAALGLRWDVRDIALSEHCDLPTSARIVLLAIDKYRSTDRPIAFPSQARLAADTGLDVRSIRRMVALLVSTGWMSLEARWRQKGGRSTNLYALHVPQSVKDNMSALLGIEDIMSGGRGVIEDNMSGAYRVFESPTKTLTLGPGENGKAKALPAETWLSPYLKLYGERCGTVEESHLAKCVAPARATLGDEAALKTLGTYLDSSSARFGINYFLQQWRQFVPEKLVLDNGDLNPKALEQAKRLGVL